MAEMTERRILVFDASGLISNVDRLSWKIKALVARRSARRSPGGSATTSATCAAMGTFSEPSPRATAGSAPRSWRTPRRLR